MCIGFKPKKKKDVGSGSPTNGDVELETESASGEMARFDLLVRSPGREETRLGDLDRKRMG